MKSKVTVFMPVYNAEKYLRSSIESILNQSYSNFEFLIIDDGSTDSSVDIIESYKDDRIVLYKNETNKGLPYTRNKGLELATGEFIALMDADDISKKDRIFKQVHFLKNNNEFGVVSSRVERLIEDKIYKPKKRIDSYRVANIQLMFNNVIGNPAAMFRKDIINKYNISYRNECFVGQDYAFWIDCSKHTKLAILSEPLLIYRTGHENITKLSMKKNVKMRRKVIDDTRTRCLKNNGIILTQDEVNLFNTIFSDPDIDITLDDISKYRKLLLKITQLNNVYEKGFFAREIKQGLVDRVLRVNYNKIEKVKSINFLLPNESFKSYLISIIKVICM